MKRKQFNKSCIYFSWEDQENDGAERRGRMRETSGGGDSGQWGSWGIPDGGLADQGPISATSPLATALMVPVSSSFSLPLSRIHTRPVNTRKYGLLFEGVSCLLFGEGIRGPGLHSVRELGALDNLWLGRGAGGFFQNWAASQVGQEESCYLSPGHIFGTQRTEHGRARPEHQAGHRAEGWALGRSTTEWLGYAGGGLGELDPKPWLMCFGP